MKFYGKLESLLAYAPPRKPSRKRRQLNRKEDSEAGLDTILEERVHALSTILVDIHHAIASRYWVSYELITQLYQHYCYLTGKLRELYTWTLSDNRAIEGRRSALEKQLDTLKQEKRREDVERWRDVAELRKERRGWFKQYRELMSRVRFLFGGRR